MNSYQEIPVSQGLLQKIVDCFWFRKSTWSEGQTHTVLPDGCMDIILNFGDGWEREESGLLQPNTKHAYVIGTMTRPVQVRTSGKIDLLGIRFKPGMATAFLRTPACQVTDSNQPLEDHLGSIAHNLFEMLRERSAHERIIVLQNFLAGSAVNAEFPSDHFQQIVKVILQSSGMIPITEICFLAGVTRQHLARLFQEHIGISPKHFSRVVRFQSFLQNAQAASVNWAGAATDHGYYDQPHMIQEFKEFAGVTPAEYFAGR